MSLVLIVDDIAAMRDQYAYDLKRLGGFDTITASGGAAVIRLVDGFVPDDTVEDYFLAADLAVLPYVSATQSGIIQIAYNYDLPVVTTNVGGLPEVVRDGETGFIVPPEDSAGLAAAIVQLPSPYNSSARSAKRAARFMSCMLAITVLPASA